MVTDTIGDFLTRIRNAQERGKEQVGAACSKMLLGIAKILKEEGFIKDFREEPKAERAQSEITVDLLYRSGSGVIRGIERVSRPGVRIYVGYRDISKVLGGMGVSILSTPKGVMSGESAKKQKVGGEYLCKIW